MPGLPWKPPSYLTSMTRSKGTLGSGGGSQTVLQGIVDLISAPFDAAYNIVASTASVSLRAVHAAVDPVHQQYTQEVVEPFAAWSQSNREWFFGIGGGLMGFGMAWSLAPLAWPFQLGIPGLVGIAAASNKRAASFGLGFAIGQVTYGAVDLASSFVGPPIRAALGTLDVYNPFSTAYVNARLNAFTPYKIAKWILGL